MTDVQNKALIAKSYGEVWAKGRLAVADEVFAPDYVRHDLRPTDALPGPEGQKKIAADFRSAFPDLQFDVELLIADGDYVAGRWTASGTHLGSWGKVEPTGRRVTFSGFNIFRFEKGKVAEIWNHRDDLRLMQQVGAPVFAGASPEPDAP